MEKLNAADAKRKTIVQQRLKKDVNSEKKELLDQSLQNAEARREEHLSQTQQMLAAQESKRMASIAKLKQNREKEAECTLADINAKVQAATQRREMLKTATVQKLGNQYAAKREKVLQRKERELAQGA